MVQQTLDATKTFIFDVRPMVLDDLGLVPTLRRATRERSRRASVPVEFESMGQDRRLPMDLESGLFRMLDEGLAAYLAAGPDQVTMPGSTGATGSSRHRRHCARAEPEPPSDVAIPTEEAAPTMPPALAALVEERRAAEQAAAEAAVRASVVILPPRPGARSRTGRRRSGSRPSSQDGGGHLHLVADLPAVDGWRTGSGVMAVSGHLGQGLVEYGLILAT